jgi:hypothetical protein
MSAHTPGHWHAYNDKLPEVRTPDRFIADCHTGHFDKDSANARLIAAAPDLYETLRKIAFDPIGHPEASDSEILNAITELARAAIAKAVQS